MKTHTTTRLALPRAWWELSTPACATICLALLVLTGLAVGRYKSLHQAAAMPTPALANYIIIASPVPVPTATPVPVQPTPDGRVLEELAALRAQVAQLQQQQAQQAAPQVVYQPVYEPAPPAPAYEVTNEQAPAPAAPTADQPAPAMQPQQAAILDRSAWAAQAATARAGK